MGKLEAPGEIIYDVPSNLNKALDEGKLDVSMVSSIHYLRNKEKYILVPNFCIAAEGDVGSVSLYTKYTISELDQMTIGVTAESATAVELLKVLCAQFWRIKPKFQIMEKNDNPIDFSAFLLIGDACLKNPVYPDYTTIDLGKAWYYAGGLPFVFGLFVTKNEQTIPVIEEMLHKGLEWTQNHPNELIEYAVASTGLEESTIRTYFSDLHYHMDHTKAKAIGRFGALSDMRKVLETKNEPIHKR